MASVKTRSHSLLWIFQSESAWTEKLQIARTHLQILTLLPLVGPSSRPSVKREEEYVVFSPLLCPGLILCSVPRGEQDNEITACIFHGQDESATDTARESTFQINCSPRPSPKKPLPRKMNSSLSDLPLEEKTIIQDKCGKTDCRGTGKILILRALAFKIA